MICPAGSSTSPSAQATEDNTAEERLGKTTRSGTPSPPAAGQDRYPPTLVDAQVPHTHRGGQAKMLNFSFSNLHATSARELIRQQAQPDSIYEPLAAQARPHPPWRVSQACVFCE